MKRNDAREIDGSVLAYQVEPDSGLVAVTLDGGERAPMIVLFDRDDLDALNRARKELKAATIRPTYVNPRFDDGAPRAGFVTDRKWW